MTEWIVAVSAIVQATCTVLLAALTAWYACWVKRQVKQDRELFDRKAAQTADLVERQAAEAKERERAQVQRAIRTIVAELELNAKDTAWRFPESTPLLTAAFASNLWALPLIGLPPETFAAIGNAYLNIHRYDLLYVAAAGADRGETFRLNAAQVAWQDAQKAIQQALDLLRKDPATSGLARASA